MRGPLLVNFEHRIRHRPYDVGYCGTMYVRDQHHALLYTAPEVNKT